MSCSLPYTYVSLSEFEYIVLSHTFVLCSRMSIALLVRNRCTLVFFIFSSISMFGSYKGRKVVIIECRTKDQVI